MDTRYHLAMFLVVSGKKALLCVEPLGVPSVYRVGETQPVNVAAHLRLLGEDLYYIGNKLFPYSVARLDHGNGTDVFCFLSSLPLLLPATTAVFESFLSSLYS
jgi:hypothetical protein